MHGLRSLNTFSTLAIELTRDFEFSTLTIRVQTLDELDRNSRKFNNNLRKFKKKLIIPKLI